MISGEHYPEPVPGGAVGLRLEARPIGRPNPNVRADSLIISGGVEGAPPPPPPPPDLLRLDSTQYLRIAERGLKNERWTYEVRTVSETHGLFEIVVPLSVIPIHRRVGYTLYVLGGRFVEATQYSIEVPVINRGPNE